MEERNLELDDDGKIKLKKNGEDFLSDAAVPEDADDIVIEVPDFEGFREENGRVGLSDEELAAKAQEREERTAARKGTAEKLLEEADSLFEAGDLIGAGEKYLDSAAEYAADWRPWFGVVRVQTKDFTDFSEIYDCQNAYDRALRRMGEKERASLAEKYVPSMERIVSQSEEKADALEQEDAAIREAKLPAARTEFKALGVRLIVFAALFAVFTVVCAVTATLIGRVRSALILIPPIACGVIAVACLFIAAVYLKKFLAARSAYRAAQLPLTSPAGRECAKLREYAELVQSVIDDFQKA